jgi:putative transposase
VVFADRCGSLVQKVFANIGDAVGIDVGIARFATLSDGSFVEPLNSFRKHEARLRRYQRAMSRKTKFSSNWKKAKAKVQKIHTRIANVRKDFLHKASATISKNHALVVVEDLKVSNMSRSAKGTVDAPGRNVRAKSGLNKSILDQGWGEFRSQFLQPGRSDRRGQNQSIGRILLSL